MLQTRFVIGGSINLVTTLDSLGMVEAVNDLSHVRLKPFDMETARKYIKAIFKSRNVRVTTAVIDRILELVGEPIPYLLAVLLSSIFDRRRGKRKSISTEMVNDAFENDLLGGSASAFFRQYRSRIDQYYPEKEGLAAKSILKVISKASKPVEQNNLFHIYLKTLNLQSTPQVEEQFMQLMHKLENDFYVAADNHAYDFFSRVIKLWWKNYYGFQGD